MHRHELFTPTGNATQLLDGDRIICKKKSLSIMRPAHKETRPYGKGKFESIFIGTTTRRLSYIKADKTDEVVLSLPGGERFVLQLEQRGPKNMEVWMLIAKPDPRFC